MNSQSVITELLHLEAAAQVLRDRCEQMEQTCYKIRKELERIDAPAPRKGRRPKGIGADYEARAAKAMAQRRARILKSKS